MPTLEELEAQIEELRIQIYQLGHGRPAARGMMLGSMRLLADATHFYMQATDGTKTQLDGGATPSAHKAIHQDTGTDEISVAGLSGLLADDQHVLDSEAIAAVEAEATLDLTGIVTMQHATAATPSSRRGQFAFASYGDTPNREGILHFDVENESGGTGISGFRFGRLSDVPSLWSTWFKGDNSATAAMVLAHATGILTIDTINELTAAAGVTVDGVTCKDGYVGMDAIGEGDVAVPAATLAHLFYEETGGGVSGAATLMTLGVANQQAAAVKKLRVKDSAGTVTDVVSW